MGIVSKKSARSVGAFLLAFIGTLVLPLIGMAATAGDFDGDGKTDMAVWRPSTGTWFIIPSSNPSSPVIRQWGTAGDIPVPGDYDGDGKTDFAVFRPSTGTWFIIPSSNPSSPIVRQWGTAGDIPVPGDYDGDGKTDIAIWRPSTGTWFIIPSSNPASPIIKQWGATLNGVQDVPVPGDYDGDGKTDMAVWRPSTGTWYVIPTSNPNVPIIKQWGATVSGVQDIPVPGDYDGDGKTDFAVWRPSTGTWFIILSSNPGAPIGQQWGTAGDIPVPGDYDGDRKTDIAVWRPSTGTWFIIPSSAPPTATQWGIAGDEPASKPTGLILLTIITTSLPSGTAGVVYGSSGARASVTAFGGVSPYSWMISGLPSGLTFTPGTPSATISGTTCQVGSFMVKATVTDSELPTVSVSATFTLTIGPSPLSITTTSPLPNATLNGAYSTTITPANGCAPYSWSLTPGSSLPAGLAFASGSPSATISGTPTVTGTYKFTVQVTDSESPALTVSATFLLTSTESPNVTCPTTVNLTLCGTYILGLRGFNHSGGPIGLGGDFVADNAGHIATSGTEDINSSTSSTGGQTFTITGGSYAMDVSGDGRGIVTLIYSDASSTSYRFALESANSASPGTDFITSPIEEFDASGTRASGVIVGPGQLPLVPPAPGFLALSLEGANGSGQRVGLLGEVQFAGSVTIGCDGTSGTFVSVAGENVIVNTRGNISNVTFAGSCTSDNNFSTTGRSTATATVSGGTPFADSTLHFVFYQLNFTTYFFLEMDPIAANQPILSGIANPKTPVTSGITGSFVDCPCIFTEHGTTDGTITTGHSVATVIRFTNAPSGDGGTLSGIEDQNAGGSLTLAAAVSGTYTVDNNSVGTMTLNTPSGTRTIHFIIDGNPNSGGNSSGFNWDTLDDSTNVGIGSSHAQLFTTLNGVGSPHVFGLGFGDLPYGLGFGYGDLGTTPSNAQTVGVVTPTGTATSGTLPGIADVMPGLVVGSAASGSYTIDSTTGRGTGSISLTNGSTINAVFWVIGFFDKFVVLDVQTANPDLIGIRKQ